MASLLVSKAQNDASRARRAKQWDLFAPRGALIARQAAESIKVIDSLARAFAWESVGTLVTLFEVNPEASNAQMRDAISPIVDRYDRHLANFLRLGLAGLDSVSRAHPEWSDTIRARYRREAGDSLYALLGRGSFAAADSIPLVLQRAVKP